MGLFIERPFGAGKAPAEPDYTLMLASTAFSKSLAVQRLHFLSKLGLLDHDRIETLCQRLEHEPVRGLPLDAIGPGLRPGAMSLKLAREAAADFVFLRTMPGGVREFLNQFDVAPLGGDLAWLTRGGPVLFARAADGSGVRVYDAELRARLELRTDADGGFVCRAGREFPVRGLLARWLSVENDKPVRLPVRDNEIGNKLAAGAV